MQDKKNIIRKAINNKLQLISQRDRTILSNAACNRLLQSELYKKSNVIFAYMATLTEINPSLIIQTALKDGKKVALPRTLDNTNNMFFYFLKPKLDINSQLNVGNWNILEPSVKICKKANPTSIADNILMIVPGLAFTENGKRLGHGKGFYDKYLCQYKNIIKAGFCFDCQIVNALPVKSTDISMDYVITSFHFFESTEKI